MVVDELLPTVIAEICLIDDAALSLPGYVGNPDASHLDVAAVKGVDEVLP